MADASWRIRRTWNLLGMEDAEGTLCATRELAEYRSVAMLGAAGIGKTFEAQALEQYERSLGRDVRWCRLAEFAGSTEQLERQLLALSVDAPESTSIFLDALDEAMVPRRRCWKTVEQWLASAHGPTKARVRITCRPAIWQPALDSAMKALAPEDRHAVAVLMPLDETDMRDAAIATGLDGDSFVSEVRRRRAETLAAHPLTLQMLLRVKVAGSDLPNTVTDLFARAVRELASDRHERFVLDTQSPRSSEEILRAGERVACQTVLSGRQRVSLGDEAPAEAVPWSELSAVSPPEPALQREVLLALACSGLCHSRSAGEFEFVHRQIAEFLAGRRIGRMLHHNARAVLASPAGWRSGVAGPLRETAAFAAASSPAIAQWIAECDPELIGASDVADPDLRKQALRGLLAKFRSGAMTDAQVGRGEIELRGFEFSGIETDLRGALAERGTGAADAVECAVEIIKVCGLRSMDGDLAGLCSTRRPHCIHGSRPVTCWQTRGRAKHGKGCFR